MSKRFAVIGNPITHSLSPVIHQHFAHQMNIELTYEKIKGDEQHFEQQVSDFFIRDGKGLNVTLPFKQRAFAMAQKSTLRCQLAGAANTLWLQENQLHADNTDGIGLIRDLTRYIELQGKNILILGAGGAARGIIHPLLGANPHTLTVANRTVEKVIELQRDFPLVRCSELDKVTGSFDLIINATSASLAGKTVSVPENVMSQKPVCYDLAYKQKEPTPFVHYAKNWGCDAVDGIGMLVEQAAEAFFIWNAVMPETEPVLSLLRQH
ncbi:shikimate dehydrogenase [Legionella maioricensis]|uniref:Shikimate dehydrogenase (NADP(+)) n=1 Tax=Legionella maioricensis TaxID=2896528 RepID=A0A9X2CZS0_9GAMM|nr:shikimate dehydrogenase [Legionella maioricensis]MCL9683786.1 shikimate dehydrogenase [Legionella maioricensis]MCL9686633.1 shikimate dehydrogenase [Legionella maioricensis]